MTQAVCCPAEMPTPCAHLRHRGTVRTDVPPRWLRLHEGEVFIQSAGANRTAGRIAAGGWLALTSQRLVHQTHAFEKALTRTPDWQVPLSDVASWGSTPPGGIGDLFNGGLRERLRIQLHDGGEALFVVNDLDAWRQALKTVCQ